MNLFEQNMLKLLNVRGISHKSLLCRDILIVKPYHMIQISVIVFLAVQIISAQSSLDYVFSWKYKYP